MTALPLMVLAACDKHSNDDAPSSCGNGNTATVQDYAKLAIGNYWVYQRLHVDTLGVEVDTGVLDSASVVGDTLVNGYSFYVIAGTRGLVNNGPYRTFQRDSAGYLIGLDGTRVFSLSGVAEVLAENPIEPDLGVMTATMVPGTSSHTVPAGTFTCIAMRTEAVTSVAPPRMAYTFRGQGVGLVQSEVFYLSSGMGFRGKLLRYHVE